MKNEVEIIVFMIDAFHLKLTYMKLKLKPKNQNHQNHIFNKSNIEKSNKIQVITTQLVPGSLIKQPSS